MPSPDPKRVEPRNRGQAARLAFLVASGRSLRSAAEELAIPYQRAKLWNRNPAFRLQVDRLQVQWTREASAVLVAASTAAATELVRLMRESEDDAIRLRAARAILEKLPSVIEAVPPKPLAEMTDAELERYAATGAL